MRVLFVTRRFYPDIIGGGEISAYHIAKAVKDQGCDVHVCTFSDKLYMVGYREEIDSNHIHVIRFSLKSSDKPILSHLLNLELMYLQMWYYLRKVINALEPDVLHFLNVDSIFYNSLERLPKFATINSPLLRSERSGIIKKLYWSFNERELKFFMRRVDKLFAVSRAIKKLLISEGFDKSVIDVIHNPIVPHKIVDTNLKSRLNIGDKRVILYAGRIAYEKGIHKIVDAMNCIDDAVLLILGRGSDIKYKKYLNELIDKNKLHDKVKIVGFIRHSKMHEYYSIADLVVLPCTWYEPLSRMLLEACSYGIPCIASDVGGNSEIVDDGKNGILLRENTTEELIEAIDKIFSLSESQINKIRRYNIKKIEREFSPEKIGKQIIRNYEKWT